jgi:hypothetical protein
MCVVLSEETWWVTKVRQGIVADRSDESGAQTRGRRLCFDQFSQSGTHGVLYAGIRVRRQT